MNARHFDHYLGFWSSLLGFSDTRSEARANPKAVHAKATLRRLAKGQRPAR
jgi:hypothetical protein